MVDERVRLIVEAIPKNVAKTVGVVRNSFGRLRTNLRGINNVMGASTGVFASMTENINRTRLASARLAIRFRNLVAGTRGFRMEMLGLLFFGMAIQRMFTGLIRPAAELFGIFDLWRVMLQIFFIPLMEDLLPMFLWLFTTITNASPAVKSLIGWFVVFMIVLGTLLFVIATLVLGTASAIIAWTFLGVMVSTLIVLFVIVAAILFIVSGVISIVQGKWEGLGLVLIGIGAILLLIAFWWGLLVIAAGVAVYLIIKYWEEIKTFFLDLWHLLPEGFTDTIETLIDLYRQLRNFTREWGERIGKALFEGFKSGLGSLVDFFGFGRTVSMVAGALINPIAPIAAGAATIGSIIINQDIDITASSDADIDRIKEEVSTSLFDEIIIRVRSLID